MARSIAAAASSAKNGEGVAHGAIERSAPEPGDRVRGAPSPESGPEGGAFRVYSGVADSKQRLVRLADVK